MSSLGIYFGPKVIKIVESKGRKLANAAQIQQSTIFAGELEEKVPAEVKSIEIVALFKDELRKNKIEAKEATLCLSGRDLIIRTFEIPMIPREEIESAVNFEAKKYIPFKIEELVSDFQLKYEKANHTNLILYVGIKKEALNRYISILNQLNIKIYSIEYSAFSILRCLRLSGLSDAGIIGVLNTDLSGEDEVNFTVLENGFPLFSRDISLVGGPEGLLRLKEATPLESLEKLKAEIQVSLDYYNRKFPLKGIKKVFLVCHQDNRSDLEAFVREAGLSVQYVNTTKVLEKSFPYSLSLLKAYSASLAKTLRLNLKLNLLTAKQKTEAFKGKAVAREAISLFEGLKLDYKLIVLGLLIVLAPLGYGIYSRQPMQKALEGVISQRFSVASVNPEVDLAQLEGISTQIKGKVESLNNLINKQVYMTELLNAIAKDTPSGVWLADLAINKKDEERVELIMEGSAYRGDSDQEFRAINQFLENLNQNPDIKKYFNQISFDSLNRKESMVNGQMQTDFTIKCRNYQERG